MDTLGDDGSDYIIGRIENIEMRDVGQAYLIGRKPIHFHIIGYALQSYIRGNSIWNTYNGAISFHDIMYLAVSHNVVYNTMGHVFFTENAVETKNLIEYNLILASKASYSMLISDQTPASFYFAHPDNIIRNNRAAGSDRYGFWLDP